MRTRENPRSPASSRPRWVAALPVVLAIAALCIAVLVLPRRFLMNDDEGLLTHLRAGTLAPFMSPALSQVLGALYLLNDGVAWYGWWLYGLSALTVWGLVELLIGGDCTASWQDIAAASLVAGLVVGLMSTLTFTIVAILASGTGLLGLAALGRAGGFGRGRVGIFAVLLAGGVATRPWGSLAALAATAPLLAWGGWSMWRRRSWPIRDLALLVSPAVLVMALAPFAPQLDDPGTKRWMAFNHVRGKLSGHAKFLDIHRRAPEKLKQAGWTEDDWLTFQNWLFVQEERFPPAKLQRLRETGGAPRPVAKTSDFRQRLLAKDGPGPAVVAFLLALGAAVFVRLRGGRTGALLVVALAIGWYATFAVIMPTFARFPTRLSMPMQLLVAVGCWPLLSAVQPADDPAKSPIFRRFRMITAALVVLAMTAVPFARTWPNYWQGRHAQDQRRAFHERVGERYRNGAFIVVYGSGGAVANDPLQPMPRPYAYTGIGCSVFSVPFYRSLRGIGAKQGADLFPAMVNNQQAFIVTDQWRIKHLQRYFAGLGKRWRLLERDQEGQGGDSVVLLQVAKIRGSDPNTLHF